MHYFVFKDAFDHFFVIDDKHISDDFSETYPFLATHSDSGSILHLTLPIKVTKTVMDLRQVFDKGFAEAGELRLTE